MNTCISQRFLIFLRETSKLRRLHRVNDRNSRYIPKTFSPHTTLNESSLKDGLKDSRKILPYCCRNWPTSWFHILSRPRLHNFLSWGDLFLQFSILCDRPYRLFFCLSIFNPTFFRALIGWHLTSRRSWMLFVCILMRRRDEINNGLAAGAFLSLAPRVSRAPN